jgi:hypothetical protein
MLDVDEHRARMRNPLRAAFCKVAKDEGRLLQYLDGDPETVRLVEQNAGAALAYYLESQLVTS